MRRLCSGSRKLYLFVQAVLLCALLLLINHLDELIQPPFFEPTNADLEEEEDGQMPDGQALALRKAFFDGVEKLEYMYNAQMGKAKMSELVEQRADDAFTEVSKCSGTEQKRIASTREWATNGQIFVYSAYLDNRTNSMFTGNPSVQVISSAFGTVPLLYTYYCHFRHYISRHSENLWAWQGSVVKARVRWIWQRAWDPRTEFYNPFLITCPMIVVPSKLGDFESIVLVSRNSFCIKSADSWSDAANFTLITKPAPKLVITDQSVFGVPTDQMKIAVCTKGLDFLEESHTFSARKLVEWVLLQRVLGANAVTLYIYWIPPYVRLVLQRMANRKKLEIVELNLPGNSPNHPFIRHQFIQRNRQQKRRHELIPYNDCFNRYSATHHFVLVVDIDEVVVPLRHHNWQQLLHEQIAQGKWRAEPSSMSIRNVFKFWHNAHSDNSSGQSLTNATIDDANGVDNNDSLFNARWRRSATAQPIGQYGKSFVNTRSIATVFNHFGLHRLHANVSSTLHVREQAALKLHWRLQCPEAELGIDKCQQLVSNHKMTNGDDEPTPPQSLLDRCRDKVEAEARIILS